MLFRTAALLLLCASVGMCATLGSYQAEASEEGESAAVVTQAAPLDSDSGDKISASDNPEPNPPEADVQAKEPATDEDKPDGDSAVVEAPAKKLISEEEANEIRPVQSNKALNKPAAQEEASSWSLNCIRDGFQTVHGYFDSLVELVGGHNGVCQYRCRYGLLPLPRPGYKHQEPNGCSSSLVGFQVNAALDVGIPAMTRCCNQLDVCYETCNVDKYDCDARFRSCLHDICADLRKSLGFVSKVQACESMADALYNTVWTLGCRPYMNSQRASCICEGEERDEL